MKKNFSRRLIFIIIVIIIFAYSFIGSKGEVVENLEIPAGIGYDLEESIGKEVRYSVPISIYVFTPEGDIKSKIITGKSENIGETREDRQRKSNKRFLLGLEKLYVISESQAEYGIHNIVDILLNNPQVSDRSPAVVFKGKAENLLRYKIKGYSNSAEYIEGMIRHSIYYNFFSTQFSMMDLIVRIDAEGRNALLPYVELKEQGPQITGLAIFKEDKMVAKTNIQEARIINLLKFNGGKGIITIQDDEKHYISYYAQSKRKVRCYKTGGKYNFVINLELNGSIASNELYPKLNKDPKELKEFTKHLENSIKKMCTEYINKAKCEYKTDILDLGKVASGTYGKHTGVDWNKVVCESNIQVNVKVKVQDQGRGSY